MLRFSLSLLAALTLSAQDTMHDAPAALENGSVKAILRSDTIIHRDFFPMADNVLMAHTHQFSHILRIVNPGKPVSQIVLQTSDQIVLRLTNNAVLSITQQDVPGAGAAVRGHAAITSKRLSRDATALREIDAALAARGHYETPHWMWVIAAPANWNWRPAPPDNEVTIRTKIQNTGNSSNHSANAQPITYQLFNGADGNFTMRTVEIYTRGQKRPRLPAIELSSKGSIYLCENRRISGKVTSACTSPISSQKGGNSNSLPN